MIEHEGVLKRTFNTAANLIKSTMRLKNYLVNGKRSSKNKIAKFALKIKNETHLFRKLRTRAENFE